MHSFDGCSGLDSNFCLVGYVLFEYCLVVTGIWFWTQMRDEILVWEVFPASCSLFVFFPNLCLLAGAVFYITAYC